jgi:hypothetical protein
MVETVPMHLEKQGIVGVPSKLYRNACHSAPRQFAQESFDQRAEADNVRKRSVNSVGIDSRLVTRRDFQVAVGAKVLVLGRLSVSRVDCIGPQSRRKPEKALSVSVQIVEEPELSPILANTLKGPRIRRLICLTSCRSAATAPVDDWVTGNDDRARGTSTTGERKALQVATTRGRLLQRLVGRLATRLQACRWFN